MVKAYDIIVISGGPAGYISAIYTSISGFDTLVLEKFSAGGQMTQTTQIDNYPGFPEGVDGFELGTKMREVADETTKTNISGVFAVGDVRTKPVRQIVTATADGACDSHFAEEYLANI